MGRKPNYEDLPLNERVLKKEKEIKTILKNSDVRNIEALSDTIHQLAFITVTLERLSKEIENSDIIDLFKQGSQELLRENPALKSYNATIKSYAALKKIIIDSLPDNDGKSLRDNELIQFITSGKK